jgi:succinate dehydrogenase / fumarate reductase iron-sulfur subunit
MKVIIERRDRFAVEPIEYEYQSQDEAQRPMALDVLLQAQESTMPGLAYRYGCRNALCGVCTIDVNGKPRLACRTRVKDGDCLGALSTLPVLKDFVVKRDEINKQLAGKLPVVRPLSNRADDDYHAFHSLSRCIECYSCLSGCSTHAKNAPAGPYRYGNPYSFLRIQKVMVDPAATAHDREQALALAISLGIADYDTDSRVPACSIGINLKKEVIVPLLEACGLAERTAGE